MKLFFDVLSFLPTANEVWDKVNIFTGVCLSKGGRCGQGVVKGGVWSKGLW